MNTHVVITRYREYIDWIQYLPGVVDKIYIYNKGSNSNFFKNYTPDESISQKMVVIPMENVGRIDHTLAYHIIQNWDSLPNQLINLPGTIMMSEKKGRYFSMISKVINKGVINTTYRGFYAPRFRKVGNNFNYSIDEYVAEGVCNRNGNKLIKSEFKDFQEWKIAVTDSEPIYYIAMRGMFIVSKENIIHVNKQIYINLLLSLSVGDNIENGHFAERIWAHLFRQYSLKTIKDSKPQEEVPVLNEIIVEN